MKLYNKTKSILHCLIEYRPDFRRWINLGFFLLFSYRLFEEIANRLSYKISLWGICSIGLPYLICFFLPLIILLLQSIYPTLLGWICLVCVTLTYTYINFSRGVQQAIAYAHGKWDIGEAYYSIIGQIVFFVLVILFLYFLKPRKRKIRNKEPNKGDSF